MGELVMQKIVWDNSFSVGHETMDYQHQQIIRIINNLITHKEGNHDGEYLSEILNELTEYALNHLRDEEKLLKDIQFPGFKDHLLLHKQYRLEIAKRCTVINFDNDRLFEQLLEYLSEWWLHHILEEDREYSYYL